MAQQGVRKAAAAASSFHRFVRKATDVARLRREVSAMRSVLAATQEDLRSLQRTVVELRSRVFDEGYLYVLRDSMQPDIFKVGRTGDVQKRLAGYPRGTELVMSRHCDDVVRREKNLLRQLKRTCEHCSWIGNEYFRADLRDILQTLDIVAPLPTQE
jgi:hypothetical protein